MDQALKNKLEITACKIRSGTIIGVYHAKSGHPGGSLSIADVLAYLYNAEMRIDPANPKWEDRDRFVMSKGHCAPALYAALAERGYFSPEELNHLRQIGALLQGHPDMKHVPGVDMSTGSLGQGISAAVGMAMAGKMAGKDYRVYAILGDGELQEGQVWEAAMLAGHSKLDNLCVYIDNNDLQIDGCIDDICSPKPIDKKFEAFNFYVIQVDAHNLEEIEAAYHQARQNKGHPTAIIGKSIKGKGVSYMENNAKWHGTAPNDEEYRIAMEELQGALKALEVK